MKLSYQRLGLLITAILLVVSSWVGIAFARSGLEVRSFQKEGIPLLYLAPQGAKIVPGVLVAHGFAGSKQLMLGYGHVLAHAGYAVMLWEGSGMVMNAGIRNPVSEADRRYRFAAPVTVSPTGANVTPNFPKICNCRQEVERDDS